MHSVTVSRRVDADPERIRELMSDVEAFMAASGFDGVALDGDALTLQNRVGLFEIELGLELVEDPDAELTYEQREGIFESMRTEYALEGRDGATEVTATTTFESMDLPVLGEAIDATVIRRQRRKEIESQFDWLEERARA